MNAIPVFVSIGAVAIAGFTAFSMRGQVSEQGRELARLEALLGRAPEAPELDASSADRLGRLTAALDALEVRMARLETRTTRSPVVSGAAGAAEEAASPVARNDASRLAEEDEEAALRAEMEELLELFSGGFDWDGDTDKLQRFYELARDTDVIDEKIAELEAGVEADPGNVDGRMQLADTYVAKLMTIQGPEQGLWGSKAESQWRTVVELDENHWQSTFNLGNNFAYYPDVMGKTDDAIAYLERARDIQEQSTQGDEHVQTYLSLARMHQRKNDLDEARRVLEEGLRYHAGDARLQAALDSLD